MLNRLTRCLEVGQRFLEHGATTAGPVCQSDSKEAVQMSCFLTPHRMSVLIKLYSSQPEPSVTISIFIEYPALHIAKRGQHHFHRYLASGSKWDLTKEDKVRDYKSTRARAGFSVPTFTAHINSGSIGDTMVRTRRRTKATRYSNTKASTTEEPRGRS